MTTRNPRGDDQVEPHVFESKTRPGRYFWLSAAGASGWAPDKATAERRAGIEPTTTDD